MFAGRADGVSTFSLKPVHVLIRGDCVGALRAMRKGSFRSPTLQDMAMRLQELFLDAGADPPLFLHASCALRAARSFVQAPQALAPAVYCAGRRPDAAGGWSRAYEGGTSAQRKGCCCCWFL